MAVPMSPSIDSLSYPLTASVMPKNEASGTTGSWKKVRPKKN